MSTYYVKTKGTQYCDTDRNAIGANNANYAGAIAPFIYCVAIGQDGRDPPAAALKLQWRISGGTFADLGATGEMKYTTSTVLSNGTAVTSSTRKVSVSNMSWQNGEEVEDGVAASIDLGNDYWSELQFAVDPSEAQVGKLYQFQLYNSTLGAAVAVESGSMLSVIIRIPVSVSESYTLSKSLTIESIVPPLMIGNEVTDTFSGYTGNLEEYPGWGTARYAANNGASFNEFRIASGEVYCNQNGAQVSYILFEAPPDNVNHYAQVDVRVSNENTVSYSLLVRSKVDSTGLTGYSLYVNMTTSTAYIERWDNGTQTTVGTGQITDVDWTVAQTIKLSVSGTDATVTLEVFLNGASQFTVADTSASRIVERNFCGLITRYDAVNTTYFDNFKVAACVVRDSLCASDSPSVCEVFIISAPVDLYNHTEALEGVAGGPFYCWGGTSPDSDELKRPWQDWRHSDGSAVTIDTSYGALTVDEDCFSPVILAPSGSKLITITKDKYATGSGTSHVYVRGDTSSFAWDTASPSWSEYTEAITQSWTYIQLKVSAS